jgi:hypothetical protein
VRLQSASDVSSIAARSSARHLSSAPSARCARFKIVICRAFALPDLERGAIRELRDPDAPDEED